MCVCVCVCVCIIEHIVTVSNKMVYMRVLDIKLLFYP